MKDGAHLTGFENVENVLLKLPGRTARKVVAGAARAGASVIRKEARVRLKPMRKSGRLSKGLMVRTAERGRDFIRVVMGPSKKEFWGSLLEFGTKWMPAKPWLTPAFDAKRKETIKAISVKLWAGIKKEMNLLKR